jgi:carboxymethylenebutenolidase
VCHSSDASFPPERGKLTQTVAVPLPDGRELPAVLQSSGQQTSAVLLISDIYGPTEFYRGLAGDLAEHGYATLVPDFLAAAGHLESQDRDAALNRSRHLDQRAALNDLIVSVDWLRSNAGGAELGGRIGVLGFCLGGTLGLDMAAEREDLAVVSYYGFPAGVPGKNPVAAPLEVADRIRGPVLAFWGEEDYMSMGPIHDFCQRLADRRDQSEYAIYPGVGHGFLGGLTSGDPAATESWDRSREFFATWLADPASSAA